MNKYKITPEQCAKVVIKNRGNAKNNPFAQAPMNLTVNDILNSKMLADPIRELDSKPVSDGACAMIIAREDKARKFCKKPIWITGVSNCYEAHYLGDRDLADCKALTKAAKRAYKMAGIVNPLNDIDVAEISGEFFLRGVIVDGGVGSLRARRWRENDRQRHYQDGRQITGQPVRRMPVRQSHRGSWHDACC